MQNYIPLAISAVMMFIALMTYVKNSNKDIRANYEDESLKFGDIKETLLKLELTLNQVNNTTNETRSDIKAMNNKINELDKEQGVIKRDLSTAFVRIDEIKDKITRLEEQ